MKIASIGVRIPSLRVSNEDVVAAVLEAGDVYRAQLGLRREIMTRLDDIGAQTRFFRDRRQGERAITLLCAAANDALATADLGPKDVDLLIYCGVGRGFVEPATAYFVAHALGLECPCFDVLDACMSWTRALELAYRYFLTTPIKTVLVVNAEFNVYECGYPNGVRISSVDELDYLFPGLTIGEASTATVLTRSADRWLFAFRSIPRMAPYCAVPLAGYHEFAEGAPIEAGRFSCFGGRLFEAAVPALGRLIKSSVANLADVDLWVPHVAASNPLKRFAKRLHLDPLRVYVNTFPKFGNLVSASIPVALWDALNSGALRRGGSVVLCPASAGMSVAVAQFSF